MYLHKKMDTLFNLKCRPNYVIGNLPFHHQIFINIYKQFITSQTF